MLGFTSPAPVGVHAQLSGKSLSPTRGRVTRSAPVRTRRHASVPRAQTWSDPAVTQEYMDYLDGKGGQPESTDGPSTIIGADGRLGNLLAGAGTEDDLLLRRGQLIPPDAPGPIYVCTRAEDLEDIILSCPEERKEDLVFMSNGFLEKLLRRHNVDKNTQANVYFAVKRLGAKPIDGVTLSNPDGLTCATGKWSQAFAERLDVKNLKCRVLFERDFRRSQLEKLIWISAYNLIGAVHGGVPMGVVADKHGPEVEDLVGEMGQMIRFTLTVGMGNNIEGRLSDYARAVKDFPTGLKEFEWRNGFFYNYSKLAKSRSLQDPTPMHTGYLEDGKKMGLIDW